MSFTKRRAGWVLPDPVGSGWRAGALLLLSACAAACSGADGGPRSAVLITLEATRLDALGAHGSAAGATPNLDLLAEHAVRYEWARTVAPLSRAAHASIVTGLYPPRHGVGGERTGKLVDRAVTVAERARAAGFQTAGFVGVRFLDQASGLAQGFGHFGRPPASAGGSPAGTERPGTEVVAEALAWLRGRDRARPFFLWVHLFDPHQPRRGSAAGAGPLSPYQVEVAAADLALGELVEALRSERLFRETFVALVGAHGEGLGEHGETTHGLGLWDSTLRVPLLFCYRDGYGAGQVSTEVVSVVDLAPTLIEAMGLEAEPDLDGISLYYQSVPSDRGVYFESYEGWSRFGWSPLVGCADAHGKFVQGARDEFFDPRRDPGELAPLPLADGLPGRYAEWIRRAQAAPRLWPEPAPVDARVLEALAALGHLPPELGATSRPPPSELAGRRDPRDCLSEHDLLEQARRSLHSGDFDSPLPVLALLRERNPAAVEVLDTLAQALLAGGKHEQAVEVLRARLTMPPERIETHRDLRICFTALGEEELARVHSLRSLELLVDYHQREDDREGLRAARALLDQTRRSAVPAAAPAGLESPSDED